MVQKTYSGNHLFCARIKDKFSCEIDPAGSKFRVDRLRFGDLGSRPTIRINQETIMVSAGDGVIECNVYDEDVAQCTTIK